MNLHTNLQGRLRNTALPKSHGLLPVFEAVVNSIHSLEEKGNLASNGQITLEFIRSDQSLLDFDKGADPSEIVGFVIKDNGIGFNDINMLSFETLDSDHKIDKGCRGVGRLLWLKAFDRVEVSSVFEDQEGDLHKRSFTFDAKNGVKTTESLPSSDKDTQTSLRLMLGDN